MDPKSIPSTDTLPGQLGLTEAQIAVAQTAIDDALAEGIPLKHVLDTLEGILQSLDTQGAIETVMQELKDRRELLHISIAYRAFALGLQAAKAAPPSAT